MSQAKITLIGMEKFLNPDHSVFESMILPDGIDRETLIGSIFLRCNEFELLYSDPEFMTDAVNIWSRKNYRTFEKWVKALNIEYEPLYNYDRTEEYTDTHKGDYEKNAEGNNSGTNKQTNNLKTENDTTLTHSEKAFNDTSFVETTEDITDGEIKDTGTVDSEYGNQSKGEEKGKDNYTNTHKARLFGNIGVTTSQQMLESELSIAEWNLYSHISDLFCSEFCIMVY